MTDTKDKKITGTLKHATLCRIAYTNIRFIFAYIVDHVNPKFNQNDWFASSYILNIEKHHNHYLIRTANSLYKVKSFTEKVIPDKAIELVKNGCPPQRIDSILFQNDN
tara:strand:- start:635 stop:958 length:324 start_codon:yes stop_codon:yes gene_type:complete